MLSCCHSYEFSKWAWLVTCFWKDYLFLLFVSNNCRIKNSFFKNMKIDVVKIIYSSKLRHWKIALRRLSWNCVDKWPNSVKRRHKTMELVLHRFMLFALKFCGDMKYFARLNWLNENILHVHQKFKMRRNDKKIKTSIYKEMNIARKSTFRI